jgi:hypothetical protein
VVTHHLLRVILLAPVVARLFKTRG